MALKNKKTAQHIVMGFKGLGKIWKSFKIF